MRFKTAIVTILATISISLTIIACVLAWNYCNEMKNLKTTYEEAQNVVQIEKPSEQHNTLEEAKPNSGNNIDNNDPKTDGEEDIDDDQIEVDEYAQLKLNIKIDWDTLHSKSNDVVGWIYIPETTVNYPMVHKDNNYYLRRDYTGVSNSGGSIFLDHSTGMDAKNIIIYGHNMRANIMFHDIRHYVDEDYARAHQYIYVVTENETRIYRVFSVSYTDKISNVYTKSFATNDAFKNYVKQMQSNSIVALQVDGVVNADRIITLSTCSGRTNNERLVVQAHLLTAY